jgi:hypothetical protein
MVNLIRRDVRSSRWVGILLAFLVAVGVAFWLPMRSTRGPRPQTVPHQPAVSVLTDPFDGQKK